MFHEHKLCLRVEAVLEHHTNRGTETSILRKFKKKIFS